MTRSGARPGGEIGRTFLLKVGQVNAAGAVTAFRACLGPTKAVVGETVGKAAKADLGSVFRATTSA
jgi:hypothetical protein